MNGTLQDIEVAGDKDDSRCLQIIVPNSLKASSLMSSGSPAHRQPLLAARFVFDDHIRCMAAKQRSLGIVLVTETFDERTI